MRGRGRGGEGRGDPGYFFLGGGTCVGVEWGMLFIKESINLSQYPCEYASLPV